jgi:hypothetical protein
LLEETYRELRLPLLRLAFLLTGSGETAEDVVQSAFASAHPGWHRIDNAPAYLRRSVVNLAKDGQRREFRRRRLLRPQPEPVTVIPEIDETWALGCGSCRPPSVRSWSCTTTRTCHWWGSVTCSTAPRAPCAPTCAAR